MKNTQRNKGKFHCFSCGKDFRRAQIARTGKRKNGSGWAVCKDCHAAWRANRAMDTEAVDAAYRDQLEADMGWNGIPSETSLRRRSQ